MRIDVAGEALVLLAERAAYVERTRTLLVADAHFGKAASFRALGVAVPRGTTLGALDRLDAALARTGASRVVFLGDFLHAREGRSPSLLAALAEWRARHAAMELVLVRGNHDRGAGDPPGTLGIRCVDEPLVEGPLALVHHPGDWREGYAIAGHLHPGARLTGPGGQREWLSCFWFGARQAVLPAFGEFTGLADVRPANGDRVIVVADGVLVDVSRTLNAER